MGAQSATAADGTRIAQQDGPVFVTHISEPQESLTAWVVVDSLRESRAMGGTRMTDSVTEGELRALAKLMTTKLGLLGLPIGGAKAGIRSTAGQPQRSQLLHSFGKSVAPLLRGGVYLGSDQGVSHADRDVFMAACGFDIRQWPGVTRVEAGWGTLWEKHLAGITGFGVATAIATALRRFPGQQYPRAVIQGFGSVGRAVAAELSSAGHQVVGIADVLGTITAPGGLPVERIVELTDPAGTIDRSRLPAGVAKSAGREAWLDVDSDILVLAAGGNSIHEGNVQRVRAPLVAEGGNMCCSPGARQQLRGKGAIVLPDVVVNAGGAAATGCILTGVAPSDLPAGQLARWIFDWVGEQITRNTDDVLDLASGRVIDPVPELLAVRRPAAW